jgi:hypothetical protein
MVRLSSRHAEALAELLPFLLCGEESAVVAFGHYSQSTLLRPEARREFALIQTDELRHASWLRCLRLTLPPPYPHTRLRRELRRFFTRIGSPDIGHHFAHIAALDSAVCVILGALRQRHRPVARDSALSALFAHIHRDEAKHVAIARRYARQLHGPVELHSWASEIRSQLTAILAERAGAFEALEVCPDRLFPLLRAVTPRLFA